MPSRRASRIVAMQLLYQVELTAEPMSTVAERFWKSQDLSADDHAFSLQLVEGTLAAVTAIDAILQETSKNWKLHRMPVVDVSILRCAAYEILYLDDIDPATSINEAVEIAKTYSTPNSPKFINGILDTIRKQHAASVDAESP